jgi:hypothetical protein
VVSDSTQETETTIVAISARSMPRAITTSPMPRPRMPRIETLRTSAMMLPDVRKLGSTAEKTTHMTTASASTTPSCVSLSLRTRLSPNTDGICRP